MSLLPSGPGARPNSSCSPRQESDGRVSLAAVFTAAPRFTGVDHGSRTFLRLDTQMSCVPAPPARFEVKTSSRPSLRTFGWMSVAVASFSPEIGEAGPNPSPTSRPLAELHQKNSIARLPISTYEGPCSSSSLFGPAL
jgi:hypothetical protein